MNFFCKSIQKKSNKMNTKRGVDKLYSGLEMPRSQAWPSFLIYTSPIWNQQENRSGLAFRSNHLSALTASQKQLIQI